MPAHFNIEDYLSPIATALSGILAWVLHRRGLFHAYRGFSAYLCADFVMGVISFLFLLFGTQRAFGYSYLIMQPIYWPLYLWLTLEIFDKALSRFRGISRVSQQVLVMGLLASLILSFATIRPELQPDLHKKGLLILYVTVGHRVVTGALTLFLLLITAFLGWFPVPLSPNVVFHTSLTFLFFLAMTVGHLYRNLTGEAVTQNMNTAIAIFAIVCMLLWIWRLRPAGEQVRGITNSATDSSWLLRQLDAINQFLLRVGK
jgi:hypothetical protein